ncbi:hypothetical protein LguiB_002158 [Lonicera macranthoides]
MSTTTTDEIESIVRDLPRDIIIDILTRLPVRSVLRFKSVCRSWYVILSNPNFTSKHFKNRTILNNRHEDRCFLFTRNYSDDDIINGITFLSNDKAINVPIKLEIPFLRKSKPLRVSGTCNGLVCLSILPLGSIILLWNPATREFKDLPIAKIPRPKQGPIKVALGFGFDPVADDYKVLRIVYYCYPLNQVEVYSLRSNTWREIKRTVQFLIFESGCNVYLKGRFHWSAIGFGTMNGRKLIVSFDMGDENFRYIMPPNFGLGDDDNYEDVVKVRWTSMVLNESLAVVACGGNGPNKKFDVWVMNEYGVAGSWTKYMSFRLNTRIDRTLGCGEDGKILIEMDTSKVVSFDTATQTMKELGDQNIACFSEVFNHMESLLPIRGGKNAEDTNLCEVRPDPFFVRKFDLA